jgi:putative transposase
VRRLYRLDGLQLRMRVRRRKHIALHRGPAPVPVGPTERWSMDFVHDTLADGRPFRILTVVDHWSRSSPVLEAGFRMSGATVSQSLDRVLGDGPVPRSITVDNVLYAESKHPLRTDLLRAVGTATLHESATTPNGLPRHVRRCSP